MNSTHSDEAQKERKKEKLSAEKTPKAKDGHVSGLTPAISDQVSASFLAGRPRCWCGCATHTQMPAKSKIKTTRNDMRPLVARLPVTTIRMAYQSIKQAENG